MEYRVSRFPMRSRFFLTANEKDFSLSLEMTMREGGTLPPSFGRRCPEGAEVGSRSGMKVMGEERFP